MKFLISTRNIFILIYILLIKITIESEDKKLERIGNAINLIISRTDGIIQNISLTLEYEKYNITFKNFNILKPFVQNISLIKEEKSKNQSFFSIADIIVAINADLYLQIFSQKDSKEIKYKSVFFEIYFNEIKFELINDFKIEFNSSKIKSINYNNLENLDFFHEFNNKKKCKFYEGEKPFIILEDIDSKLKEIFKAEFEYKIIDNLKYMNILVYDMIHIFDNFYFNFTSQEYSYIYNVQVKKIKFDVKKIDLNFEENYISIKDFSISGIYCYSGIDLFGFNYDFICKKEKEHFKFQRDTNHTKIKLFLSDCDIYDDNKVIESSYQEEYFKEIMNILQSKYLDYEYKNADNYYNSIFE